MAAEASKIFETQAEFARRRGVSRKAVTTWKAKGLLVVDDVGRVDVEATEWNLDQRPATYRGGVTHRPIRAVPGNKGNSGDRVTGKAKAPKQAAPEPLRATKAAAVDDEAAVSISPDNLPMAEAVRRKENFLGLLRKHEFEVGQNEWVRVEAVGLLCEREYATVRERLLVIPGKLASKLVGLDHAAIEIALRQEVTEALHELHDPDGIAERLAFGDAVAEGAPGAEAASDPQPDPMG